MKDLTSPSYILTFVICFLLWLLLTGSLNSDELLAGFVVSFTVSIISAKKLAILNGLILSPGSVFGLLGYLGYFLVALVKANFDLARRILSRNIPIDPAIIEIKTSMQSDLGKLVLANSITLTPGTLSVDMQENRLLVHWIDCPEGTDLAAATRTIAEGFEHHLKGFIK